VGGEIIKDDVDFQVNNVSFIQVAFLPYRVNGQYIMEGLASSFLFTIGGLGFIILDLAGDGKPKLNKLLLTSLGFIFVIVSFFTSWVFMRMKLPGYLQS
jgi:TM2 domain-containing membrane protein YozV